MNAIATTRAPSAQAVEVDAAVTTVIDLIDRLLETVAEENRHLARGIPASLSTSTARKNELAEEFEGWVARVTRNQISLSAADPAVRGRLLDRANSLRAGMDENVIRLRAAIDASRRRIDAVMQAIRTEMAAEAPYGANGRRQRGGPAPSRTGLSV